MRKPYIACTLMAAFIGVALLAPHDAWAVRKRGTTAETHATKTHKAKRSKNLGGESAAERDRRLLRECKGLPNAGACLGYAS